MSYAFVWEEEAIASLLLTLLTGIPSGIFGVVCYVLRSMALYTMAQRRQIRNAWLAWVPVLSCWILGSLSDQYRYVVKGQIKSKRKWLLGMNILEMILSACMLVVAVYICGLLLSNVNRSMEVYRCLLWLLVLAVPMAGIGIAITVIRFMALYDVYVSVDPANAVLFLVLSILVKIVEPFFLFFNRDKDQGMPPRKDTARPAEETWEPADKDYL